MKKMLILAAVALCAVFAQASSVSWKFSTTKDYKDYTVYVCADLAEGGFKDVADIQSHLLGTDGNSGVISGTRTFGVEGTARGLTVADGTIVDFYYVIVGKDQDAGYWTVSGQAEAYSTATQHADSAIPVSTTTQVLSTPAQSWAGGDVPEPTSGLLLLVGGAALALRRKQK